MRTVCLLSVFIGGLVTSGPGITAQPDDGAAEVIREAVKAQGGKKQLAKLLSCHLKLKGTMLLAGKEASHTTELWVKHPGRQKGILRFELEGQTVTIIRVLSGDKGWASVDGKIKPCSPEELKNLKHLAYGMWVRCLFPLLEDNRFTLTRVEGKKAEQEGLSCVKVNSAGQPEMRLYFSKKTKLTVRMEIDSDGPSKQIEHVVIQYSDYKDHNGLLLAERVTHFLDGIKKGNEEMVQAEFPKELDDSIFDAPK